MSNEVEVDVSQEIGMLYDSEVLELGQLVKWMNNRYRGKSVSIERWMEEITERIAKLGFNSVVRMLTDEEYEGEETSRMWWPSIVLLSRIEADEEFDHDRMGHEVRSNIRGLNPGGNTQKTSIGQAGAAFTKTASGLHIPKG